MEKPYLFPQEAFASSMSMVANLGASILASSKLTAQYSYSPAETVLETPVSIERPQAPEAPRKQVRSAA